MSDNCTDYNLATNISPYDAMTPGNVLALTEAFSVVRVQKRLQSWLGIPDELSKCSELTIGDIDNDPAVAGQAMARKFRSTLGVTGRPIADMRKLLEDKLGIPVVNANLESGASSFAIDASGDDGERIRGVVVNVGIGTLARRNAMARGLAHVLLDDKSDFMKVKVGNGDTGDSKRYDYVSNLAMAFANSLTEADSRAGPQQMKIWGKLENYLVQLNNTSTPQRQGVMYMGLLAECYHRKMLSAQTCALYAGVTEAAFAQSASFIRTMLSPLYKVQ